MTIKDLIKLTKGLSYLEIFEIEDLHITCLSDGVCEYLYYGELHDCDGCEFYTDKRETYKRTLYSGDAEECPIKLSNRQIIYLSAECINKPKSQSHKRDYPILSVRVKK